MIKKTLYSSKVKEIGDNRVRFILTEKKVDRDGDVIVPDGIILDEYKTNPIVLFGHGWGSEHEAIPIGKIDMNSFEITKELVAADVVFDAGGKDDFAAMIFDKVKNGFLNTGSIRFQAKEVDFDPIMEGQTGVTVNKWHLLEFSIVPLPSNTGAVAQRQMKEFKEELEKKFPKKSIANLFKEEEELEDGKLNQELTSIDNKLNVIKTLITDLVIKNKEVTLDESTPIEKEVKEKVAKAILEKISIESKEEEIVISADDLKQINDNLESIKSMIGG